MATAPVTQDDSQTAQQIVRPGPSDARTPDSWDTQTDQFMQQSPASSIASQSLLARMVSQDIYLCTTIDLMRAKAESAGMSFAFFQSKVTCPFVTPYDPINWQHFKDYAVTLAGRNELVAAALAATQSLYKAQANSLSVTKALSLCSLASEMLPQSSPPGYDGEIESLLVRAFLLHLAEMVLPEDMGPGPFAAPETRLLNSLESSVHQDHQFTPISVRMLSWLLNCHTAARRGGNPGILSTAAQALIQSICCKTTTLPPLATSQSSLYQSVLQPMIEPIYSFYFRLQLLCCQVAELSHYHRSRVTSEDQEEVSGHITRLKTRMQGLWAERPAQMRSTPQELRECLSEQVAEPLLLVIAICTAVYHAEIVEVGRNLSDPPLASEEARCHLRSIRAILENEEWPTLTKDNEGARLHAAFLRPLFLCAIESIHMTDSDWAVEQIRRISDPISRSQFFAKFAQSLSQVQRDRGRRVTTKWWCWQEFGVTPPYL